MHIRRSLLAVLVVFACASPPSGGHPPRTRLRPTEWDAVPPEVLRLSGLSSNFSLDLRLIPGDLPEPGQTLHIFRGHIDGAALSVVAGDPNARRLDIQGIAEGTIFSVGVSGDLPGGSLPTMPLYVAGSCRYVSRIDWDIADSRLRTLRLQISEPAEVALRTLRTYDVQNGKVLLHPELVVSEREATLTFDPPIFLGPMPMPETAPSGGVLHVPPYVVVESDAPGWARQPLDDEPCSPAPLSIGMPGSVTGGGWIPDQNAILERLDVLRDQGVQPMMVESARP